MAEIKTYGEGDCYLIENIFPNGDELFGLLRGEVPFGQMFNQSSVVPRKICVQRDRLKDGKRPLYRHPFDGAPPECDWTPGVQTVRDKMDNLTGQANNHCLVQLYENGKSFIGRHTDKTLDIVPKTAIINVSFGAQRTMVLEHKEKTKEKQRITLPHNSALIFGLETNRKWKHSIKEDRRPDNIKTPEELAFGEERISMTFRAIGTFVDEAENISGQGAYRGPGEPDLIAQQEAMLTAFGQENGDPYFDWQKWYGQGFTVANLGELVPTT